MVKACNDNYTPWVVPFEQLNITATADRLHDYTIQRLHKSTFHQPQHFLRDFGGGVRAG